MFASAAPATRPGRLQWGVAAEALVLAGILGVGLALRLYDLEGQRASFPDLFDEGIRAEQLLLMANGFRPFRDIYAAQGVLLLDLLYPFYVLFGGTLGAIRLAVGLLSLVGIIGIWWSGRQVAGATGGLVAALLLSTSPAYLESSRLALAEVPSLAPAILALGCALRWHNGGSERWLWAAAVLATVAVLIKPMVLAIAVPLGLLVLLRPGLKIRHVAIPIAIALGVTAVLVLIMGPNEVYQQIVGYRVGARQGGTWDLRASFKEVLAQPFRAQPGLFLTALAGGLLALAASGRKGLALVSWPLATLAVLLVYTPIHPKHLVYIFPPLALTAGVGIGHAARLAWKEGRTGRTARLATVGIAAVLAAVTVGSPASSRADAADDDPDLHVFDKVTVASIQALSTSDEFILTDHPFIAAQARRLVPPDLVDPSRGRTRAGTLTDRHVIDAAAQYDVELVLIWADRLRRLPGVPPWLDRNYVLSHSFGTRNVKNARGAKDRSIYLRRDVDLAAARSSLEGLLDVRETADYQGQLRLLGAATSASSVDSDEQFTVTVGWLALAPMSTDYHVTVQLVGPRGDIHSEQEHDIEGSQSGTSRWQPGRWLFRSFAIKADENTDAGDYRLEIGVVDPKSGKTVPPTLSPGATKLRRESAGTLTVANVQLR